MVINEIISVIAAALKSYVYSYFEIPRTERRDFYCCNQNVWSKCSCTRY